MKKVSVIIPVRDRNDYLVLSLASYLNQTYPRDKFEVILVDDASKKLDISDLPHKFPFSIKVIRNRTPLGAGLARHEGVKASSGEIILFTDSDMIIPRNFIASHAKYHNERKGLVVTSPCRHRIYTKLYPNDLEKKVFKEMLKIDPKLKNKIPTNFRDRNEPIQLFNIDDITNGKIQKFTKKLRINKKMEAFLDKYGKKLKGCPIPWITFITYSASLTRKTYEDVGGFYKNIRYRHSDRALGHRLYLKGYQFICDSKIIATHQQHPVHKDMNKWVIKEFNHWLANTQRREVYLFGLRFINSRFRNVLFYSELISELNQMKKKDKEFITSIDQWIEAWIKSLSDKKQHGEIVKQFKPIKKHIKLLRSNNQEFEKKSIYKAYKILKKEKERLIKEAK